MLHAPQVAAVWPLVLAGGCPALLHHVAPLQLADRGLGFFAGEPEAVQRGLAGGDLSPLYEVLGIDEHAFELVVLERLAQHLQREGVPLREAAAQKLRSDLLGHLVDGLHLGVLQQLSLQPARLASQVGFGHDRFVDLGEHLRSIVLTLEIGERAGHLSLRQPSQGGPGSSPAPRPRLPGRLGARRALRRPHAPLP